VDCVGLVLTTYQNTDFLALEGFELHEDFLVFLLYLQNATPRYVILFLVTQEFGSQVYFVQFRFGVVYIEEIVHVLKGFEVFVQYVDQREFYLTLVIILVADFIWMFLA